MRTLLVFVLTAHLAVAQTPSTSDEVAEHNRLGVAASRDGRHAEAVDHFDEAITLRKAAGRAVEPVLVDNLVTALLGAASAQITARDFRAAGDTLHRARSLRPRDPHVLSWTGILAYSVGRRNTALEFLQAAIDVDERTVIAHEYLGHVYYARELLEKAVASWKRAIELDPARKKFLGAPLGKAERELAVESGMRIETSTHFKCKYGNDHARATTGVILGWLEDAYHELGGRLHQFPRERLTVVLYGDKSFNVVSGGHEWAAALYDGKIRVPVQNFRTTKRQLKKTLRHEYCHFLVRSITPQCPSWINEGLAQLAEGEPSRTVRSRLREMSRAGTLIPIARLVPSFARISERDRAWLAYAEAVSFVTFLRDEHGGLPRLEELLRALAKGDDWEATFYRVYHRRVEFFDDRWRESL